MAGYAIKFEENSCGIFIIFRLLQSVEELLTKMYEGARKCSLLPSPDRVKMFTNPTGHRLFSSLHGYNFNLLDNFDVLLIS